jgi:hypothetical protein
MASLANHRPVMLVGSVPLMNSREVFCTAATILGDRIKRIPDGETGDRLGWVGWQFTVFATDPAFDVIPPDTASYAPHPKVRLRSRDTTRDLTIGPLGYARAARDSYAEFVRLRDEGVIPRGCRFQVSLPTPLAPICSFVVPEDQPAVEPFYEKRLLAEVDEICAAIPHESLALQWDVAIEIAIWEGLWPVHFTGVKPAIIKRLVRIADRIHAGVELGFHLCYGDYGHHHFKEPVDTANLVEVANAVTTATRRPINWIHVPVPRDRDDDAYFAPLRNLIRPTETELYLGLIHFTDGATGARRRIAAASRVLADFGIATECGLGRRPPATIPDLLRLHAEVAD